MRGFFFIMYNYRILTFGSKVTWGYLALYCLPCGIYLNLVSYSTVISLILNYAEMKINTCTDKGLTVFCAQKKFKGSETRQNQPDWPPAADDRANERGGERGHCSAENTENAGMKPCFSGGRLLPAFPFLTALCLCFRRPSSRL